MLSVILLSMLMILLSILSVIRHLICGNNLNWLLNLNLIYETLGWGKKWLVDFNAGKTQLISFDRSNNTGAVEVKMEGFVLKEKSSFKMLGLTFSSKLDWGSYIPRKLEPWFIFLSPHVFLYLHESTIQPCMEYCTVVMSRLVLLVATWNCWISYRNKYAGLLVFHLLPLLNHWLMVRKQPV